MVVCRYYAAGHCKFGARCSFEHVDRPPSYTGEEPGWTGITIEANLSSDRPIWPFSSFGSEYHQNLLKDRDLSFEELHLASLEAAQQGALNNFNAETTKRQAQVREEEDQVKRNLQKAISYLNQPVNFQNSINDAFNPPSSHNTLLTSNFGGGVAAGTNAFGRFSSPSSSNAATFGQVAPNQPSAFGQSALHPSNPFAGAVSQSNQSSASRTAFGASSQSNQSPQTQTQTSFGQTANLGNNSAFGSSSLPSGAAFTSPFAKMSSTSPSFGQPSSLANHSASFGRPSLLGNQAVPQSPFAASTTSSTFGQNTQLGSTSPFSFGSRPREKNGGSVSNGFTSSSPLTTNTIGPARSGTNPNMSSSLFTQTPKPSQHIPGFAAQAQSNGQTIGSSADVTLSNIFGELSTAIPENGPHFFEPRAGKNDLELSPRTAEIPGSPNIAQLQLSQQILDAFRAEKFVFGRVPEIEPPMELRI